MRRLPNTVLSALTALTVGGAVSFTAHASSAARPGAAALPVLRLDYFSATSGKLASTLDPALVTSSTAADTIAMVDANLVAIGVDNKVHLQLAEKYTVSKNRKVYTFTIRPTARYSNGHYVTAADIKASIEETLAPATASPVATTYLGEIVGATAYNAGKATSVSGLKVLGKRVIQFTITKPFAYFLKTLTYPTADALDQTVIKGKTRSSTG
ncbi:MAG: hypothetical protein JOZ41_15560, partial [Chloroflexi bacterium]|nr:hypothetical protein [Chloroflexota bacterium]